MEQGMDKVIFETESKELMDELAKEEQDEGKPINRRCDPNKIIIDCEIRMELIKWMCELKDVYELNDETCETCVLLMDVTCASKYWSIGQFQLICATSLFMAAKYEETFYPSLSEFVYLCDELYRREDFLKMEAYILKVMDFRLTRMNYHSFAKFMVLSHSPPEIYLKCMGIVAIKLLGVKGCLLMDQTKVAKVMMRIIEKGYNAKDLIERNDDDETKAIIKEMSEMIKILDKD